MALTSKASSGPSIRGVGCDFVLAWLLRPHGFMQSPEPRYLQVGHAQTRLDVLQCLHHRMLFSEKPEEVSFLASAPL